MKKRDSSSSLLETIPSNELAVRNWIFVCLVPFLFDLPLVVVPKVRMQHDH